MIYYKELDVHPVWLPSIDASAATLVTNPEGIEVFATPPPDPMQDPLPDEVELRTREVRDSAAMPPGAKKAKATA